jgi:hypothetical protein
MRMAGGMPIKGGFGLIAVIVIAALLGVNPLTFLGGGDPGAPVESAPPGEDPMRDFVTAILGSTEETWGSVFASSGRTYREPSMVIFSDLTNSACGTGQSAMGPFYCPLDQAVYIDLTFYNDLRQRLGAPGDFAQAYVIAHEVGHHVQNLLGTMEQVQSMRSRQGEAEGNATSVRVELQADCYAGVWFRRATEDPQSPISEVTQDDLRRAVDAAQAVGDDRIQQKMQGQVSPESWTHGSAAMRRQWLAQGFNTGDPNKCDTFARNALN